MKKTIICAVMALTLLLSAVACGKGPSASDAPNPTPSELGGGSEATAFPPITEMPVKLRYDRMWIYGDYAETEDAALIVDIVAAVNALKVGEPSDVFVTDYTDILTFTFADGTTLRLEFEEYNWVKNDRERYHVDGLSPLRSLLDNLLEESEKAAAGR